MGVHDRCLMTWQANRKRWRKIHKGQLFQVTCSELGVPETKEQSYQSANQWWRERLATVPKVEPMVRMETYDFDTGEPTGIMVDIPQSEIEYRKSRVAELRRGFDALLRPTQVPQENTLGYHVDQWLNRQRAKVSTNDLTPGRYDNLRRAITLFRDFIGSTTPIEDINSEMVDKYYTQCHGRIIAKFQGNEGGWSTDYAKFVFETSKAFIKACWSRSLLELPRNLDEHKIKVQPKTIKPITVADFKAMVDHAKGQLRLHLLLMLNCGMRSTDISDLLASEVDWEEGRIIRQRSKTRKHNAKDVPTVDYRLWDETFALLKEYRSGDDTVLKTKSGGLWAWEEMVDGKLKSSDNIATNYNRLKSTLKIDTPLSGIRKCGASTLNAHEHYGRYANHYLGESPRSIKDKHYAEPSVVLFDTILKWLGEQFGFKTSR
jgi:integrase